MIRLVVLLALRLLAVAACSDDDKSDVLPGGQHGDGAVGSGADAGDGSAGDAGPDGLSFDGLATDPDRAVSADWDVPADWVCRRDFALDRVCDCFCGALDPACDMGNCADVSCYLRLCDACFDPAMERIACECTDDEGNATDCKAPPTGYQCGSATRADGVCDCGCGEADPDCAGAGCAEGGCMADGCQVCHDEFGRPLPCPGLWRCGTPKFADGNRCDCGCGQPDPDCGGGGCTGGSCEDGACEARHDDNGRPIKPNNWTCDDSEYATGDGCDCGCGAPDPDCIEDGCTSAGCTADVCDRCHDGGTVFTCDWQCDLAQLGDGVSCDCGCGAEDPDCRGLGCAGAGCYADACQRCNDADGPAASCEPGLCAASYLADGVCDCGCRAEDPDCPRDGSCLSPGCSDDACARCHGDDGAPVQCGGWTCGLERQGAGDGCNCGCGLADSDCARDEGCAEGGCLAPGCATCRAVDGSAMGCGP